MRRPAEPDPSWFAVIITTLRLWLRRRILRVPDSHPVSKLRGAALAAATLVVVLAIAAAAIAVARSPATTDARRQASRPSLTPAQVQARAAAAAATAANVTAATSWIAAQVSHSVAIGCDPSACAAILAAGYPSGGQTVLQPGVALPGAGALIVATPAVRSEYGAQLASAGPELIATFGSGPEAVQVRVIVAGGQAGYTEAAASALTARRRTGRKLTRAGHIHARGSARTDLLTGLVDQRLSTVLRRVAARHRVYIRHFGDSGPLAGPSVPYRMAEIIGLSGKHRAHRLSELTAVERLLRRQKGADRGRLTVVPLANGAFGLKITFPAPSRL